MIEISKRNIKALSVSIGLPAAARLVITVVMTAVLLFGFPCFSAAASQDSGAQGTSSQSAGSQVGGSQGAGSQNANSPGGGPMGQNRAEADSEPRTPENPLADSVLDYELVEKGTPYDAAGLLTYRIENGQAIIMSCDPAITGELYLPEYIEGAPVTAINDYAFLYCANLTSVTIPQTVTDIGDYAFCYCTNLASVTMGGSKAQGVRVGDHSFYRCYALSRLDYGVISEIADYGFAYSGLTLESMTDGLETVGKYAFAGCEALTRFTLPESVKSVGDFAFSQCSSLVFAGFPAELGNENTGGYIFYDCDVLANITPSKAWAEVPDGIFSDCANPDITSVLKEGMTAVGEASFYHCGTVPFDLKIPSTIQTIGDHAFSLTKVSSVELPEGLSAIGAKAFWCTQLTELRLPDSLQEIGGSAFYHTKLTSLTLGDRIESVGTSAFAGCDLTSVVIKNGGDGSRWGSSVFSGCSSLVSINLPQSWTVVPEGLLYGCSALTSIDIPTGVTEIGDDAFAICKALKEVRLPSGLKKIGSTAFSRSGIIEIDIPSTVMEIGDSAFTETAILSVDLSGAVTSIGDGAFYDCASLKTVKLGNSLTSIGKQAFYGCSALVSVTLPDSVTALGESAFERCTALQTAILGDGLEELKEKVFYGCTALEKVKLPKVLKCIGCDIIYISRDPNGLSGRSFTFGNCKSLKEIDFPEGLMIINAEAFFGCESLKEIRLPSTLKGIGRHAFQNCGLETVTLAEGISQGAWTYLSSYTGDGVFYGCTSLKNINIPSNWTAIPEGFLQGAAGPSQLTIPSNITSIGAHAFEGCTGLTSIVIPDSVTGVGKYAFYESGLTSISIPDSVTEENFGEFAIGGCTKLAQIHIPSTWTTLPDGLLQGNEVLTSFTIPENIRKIGESAFSGSLLTEIILPDTVEEIETKAFQNCKALKKVTLSKGLKTLGTYAFDGCSALTGIEIPSSLEEIDAYAFADCDAMTRVEITEGVTAIDGCAFGFCDSLAEVVIPDSVTNICYEAFYGSNPGKLHLTVSKGSVGAAFAAAVLYVNSDYNPAVSGMTFEMKPKEAVDSYYMTGYDYSITYEGLKYSIEMNSNSTVGSKMGKWTYNYTTDMEASITAVVGTFTGTDVVIGDYVKGSTVPITAVDGEVFAGCTTLTSVTLGGNLKSVSGGVFKNCTNLRTVDMSGSKIKEIGRQTFQGCTSLSDIRWSSALSTIGNSAFEGCTNLTSLNFQGTSLGKLGISAFKGCSSLSSLTLREGVSWIDNNAFADTELKNAYIPESIYLLQPTAFDRNVTIHFTGDATKVLYYWKDENDGIRYSPVLPILLERNGVRIGQFFGEGLDNQDTYFISTESAGLNIPYGMQSASVVFGIGAPAGDLSSEASGELEAQASAEEISAMLDDVIPDMDNIPQEETEKEESEEPEESTKLYEVVSDMVASNPLAAAALAGIAAILIVFAGVRRYRKAKSDSADYFDD